MTTLIVFLAKYLVAFPVALAAGFAAFSKRRREFVIYAVITGVLALALAQIASSLYYDPRPFVVLNIPPLVAHAPDNGFPSDHMLLSSTLAAAVTPFSTPLAVAMWILAFFVGVGRVLSLVHHPLDIVGSFIIAVSSAWLVWRFRPRRLMP